MNVWFNYASEVHKVCIEDDLEDTSEIVAQIKREIATDVPQLAAQSMFAAWICDETLNSMADDRNEIFLGDFPN